MEFPPFSSNIALGAEARFDALFDAKRSEIRLLKKGIQNPQVLLVEGDKLGFIAGFFAAALEGASLFLGNPNWRQEEWAQVSSLVSPDLIWGASIRVTDTKTPRGNPGFIYIPTGGSSGKVRFAAHTLKTLIASACSTVAWLGGAPYCALNILPVCHVSGLMPYVRAWLSSGKVLEASYTDMKQGNFPVLIPNTYHLSLVATQLKTLLGVPFALDWLRGFRGIFFGGGPASDDLLEYARASKLPIILTYGMTETASMISALKVEHFLAGEKSCGKALPEAHITIKDEIINVSSPALCFGYYPDPSAQPEVFETTDRGLIDAGGDLVVLGRSDRVIISGGEKIHPEELERTLYAVGVSPVHILSTPHPVWGSALVAVYEAEEPINEVAIVELLKQQLAPYKIPKHWVRVDALPYNEKGKLSEKALERLIPAFS